MSLIGMVSYANSSLEVAAAVWWLAFNWHVMMKQRWTQSLLLHQNLVSTYDCLLLLKCDRSLCFRSFTPAHESPVICHHCCAWQAGARSQYVWRQCRLPQKRRSIPFAELEPEMNDCIQAPGKGVGDGMPAWSTAQVSVPTLQAASLEYCCILPVSCP